MYTKRFQFWPRIPGDICIKKSTPRYRLVQRVETFGVIYYEEL